MTAWCCVQNKLSQIGPWAQKITVCKILGMMYLDSNYIKINLILYVISLNICAYLESIVGVEKVYLVKSLDFGHKILLH